jgi:REP element-mobilizing transposase RayT
VQSTVKGGHPPTPKGLNHPIPMPYTCIIYHIVFSTKHRDPVLKKDKRPDLFRYMWGMIKNKKCHLYRINAVEDHIHILSSLHPTVALADFIKDLKVGSSKWIKESGIFPAFRHWQISYGAFTHSEAEKKRLIRYIVHQQEHHRDVSYRDEMISLVKEAGLEWDERFLN